MGRFHFGFLIVSWFLAGLLPAPPADAGEVSASVETAGGSPLATRLQESLVAQGWTTVSKPDGSIEYHQASPDVGPTAVKSKIDQAPEESLADRLQRALQQQGWVRLPDQEGNIVYQMPVPELPTTTATAEPAAAPLSDRLKASLEQQGWTAEPAEDGSVIYRMPSSVPESASAPAPVPTSATTVAEQLREALKGRGWTALPDRDGNLVYQMPLPESQAADTGSVAAAAPAAQLRDQLEGHGWRASPAGDGAVYYLPPEHAASVPTTLSQRLKASMERQGWIAVPAHDGSVIYRMPTPAGSIGAQAAAVTGEPPVISPDVADEGLPIQSKYGATSQVEADPSRSASKQHAGDASGVADSGAESGVVKPEEVARRDWPAQSRYPYRAWAPPPRCGVAPGWQPAMGWRQSPWAVPGPNPYYPSR